LEARDGLNGPTTRRSYIFGVYTIKEDEAEEYDSEREFGK